ncbi:Phr family secreted Rap phosphatase inhibitor [Bacillus cereus]|uniref:Phr family secreted Rap phosphatase inhibitor n=1 Tax=Bacillus cereus TaxID=1396 RepID=A0A2A8ZW41_BACCE|nr:Phr family secreted Rap phosphatase inhibitor [Bacillus cereus]PFE11933.1 Phr family secreted Rap phosphatase inhibitor [Bacillus cereus]
MKKFRLTIAGLTLAGIMTFGISNNLEFSALNKGDTPAPQRPDLAFSAGHIGTSPEYTHGEGWSSSYTHGEPWGIADGNTGAPTYDHGRPPAPQA